MLMSLLFFICVALNTCLVWACFSGRLLAGITDLAGGLSRTRLYFTGRLTENREKALRQRTILLLRQLTAVAFYLAGVVVLYSPSVLFAHFRSNPLAAFYAPEALAGMFVGTVAIGMRKLKK